MTDPAPASAEATRPDRPRHVWVYGNDHSPWVQAVLLGLHEKRIAHALVTVPPLSVFLRSGVLMPAAKIEDGPWRLDSERILVELGFSEVDADTRRALRVFFGSSALRRTDDGWEFWRRFSYARDGHPSAVRRLWNHFWRAFSIFYFFALIRVARRRRPAPTRDQLVAELSFFQERLAPGSAFLGGGAPDTVDLQLFGLVQMCASIPGPALAVLREEPKLRRLREWIEALQSRFSDYPHLYTARLFEPTVPAIRTAPLFERVFFWFGAASMWIASPVTLPTVLLLARRIRRKGLQRP